VKRIVLVTAGLLALAALVAALVSCESADQARARLNDSAANLERARADAYAQKLAADTTAADRAHERALETLPFVLAVGGGIVLLVVAGLVFWDLRQQPRQVDPALLLYLERQRLDQVQMWRAIAALERRSLPAGENRGEVTIFNNGSDE
jgi:hypothetical protein